MKSLGLAVVCAFLVAAPGMRAATLTFDGSICSASPTGGGAFTGCSDYSYLNQSYGDTATANITFRDLINPGNSLRFWDNNYNNLTNVAWGGNGDGTGQSHDRIEIAPTAGGIVTLTGFDLGAYPNTQRNSTVVVYDLMGNVLHNYGSVTIGTGNLATHFGDTYSSTSGIAIEWQDSAYNVGIDNINYSATAVAGTPEPSSLVLLGTGALGMLGGLRRRLRA